MGVEDPLVLKYATAVLEPNGAQTGVKGWKTFLGSHVITLVNVLSYPNVLRSSKLPQWFEIGIYGTVSPLGAQDWPMYHNALMY